MAKPNAPHHAIKGLPDQHLYAIFTFITGFDNMTETELSKPILRPGLQDTIMLFIIQYAFLSILGMLINIWVIYYIIKHKLYRDNTHAFFINLSVCHFFQCAFVVPVTLVVIVIHNWILGQFMCYFVPMLQDIPIHAAVLTHLLIAWDRMRWLNDPMNSRFPAFVCSCATWLTGMVIALPYPIYTTYLDLGSYLQKFHDVGICVVNLVDDSQEYTRGLFFLMYVAPSIILAYLYIHTAKDLRIPNGELSVMMYEQRADIIAHRHHRHSRTSSTRSAASRTSFGRTYDMYDAQADASREQRTQFLLGAMAACEIICIGPLMALRFARQQMYETYENSSHFDITYLMLVWMAFLPTIIIPCIYSCWILSGPVKDRIWRYFRLSSRRSNSDNKLEAQHSVENSITQENTTETLDIEAKMPLARKLSQSRNKVTGKVNPKSHSLSASKTIMATNRLSPNRASIKNKNVRKDLTSSERTYSIDEINNSCSNITASTYVNGNEISTSSGNVVDYESCARSEQKLNCDRESVYSGISNDRSSHRSHDRLSDSGNLLLRRESTSTYERDMDIIDLLERERSIDMEDIIHQERRTERYRKKVPNIRTNSGAERRKLPDIAKITAPASPKRLISSDQTTNFPNFVFTHQFNEFAEARNNRNRDFIGASSSISAKSRNNSQSSYGQRNSDAYLRNDEENASCSNVVAHSRSADSRKSSTKSVHDNRVISGNVYKDGTNANNL